jgi:hypothetical protein
VRLNNLERARCRDFASKVVRVEPWASDQKLNIGRSVGRSWATVGGDKRADGVTNGEPAEFVLTVHAGAQITSRHPPHNKFLVIPLFLLRQAMDAPPTARPWAVDFRLVVVRVRSDDIGSSRSSLVSD